MPRARRHRSRPQGDSSGPNQRIRLHRGRCRLLGLRAGGPPERRSGHPGAAARSRSARQIAVDSPADRLRQDDVERHLQLALQHRSGSQHERPAHLLAARQDTRRLEFDQRPDLHPRAARGLRPLGRTRQHRLGFRRRAALLRQIRGQPARRDPLSRWRRAAEGVRHRREKRTHRGFHRRRGAGRCETHRRFQRRPAGRCRLLPAHHPQGLAGQHRQGLPRHGARPAESAHRDRGLRRRPDHGRHARGWRALSPGWCVARGPLPRRGAVVGRGDPVAAVAPALGHRAAQVAAGSRGAGGGRCAECRREPAGSPPGAARLRMHQADHDQRPAQLDIRPG